MQNTNLKTELETLVSENTLKALYLCSQAADEFSLNIYLIGGAVRDIVAGKNHFDTDVTVQGNAVDFVHFLEKNYENCRIKEVHEKFKTVKVIFIFDGEETEIDFASTRKENYPYPGSLPEIEETGCELYEDVTRRDFSINAMALSLNKKDFGELTDYTGGYEDLKNKTLCVLHDKSFIDDPTRIIRALKFRVRFECNLNENTRRLQNECLKSGRFDNLCGERIKSEFKQTFNLNKAECAEIFLSENLYRLVSTEIKIPENRDILYENCKNLINNYSEFINPDSVWLIYLSVILCGFPKNKISEIAEKLHLANPETDILTGTEDLRKKALIIEKECTNFEIYEYFEGFASESIIAFTATNRELSKKAEFYFRKLKDIKINTTGNDLIKAGLKPGEVFGKILRELLKTKLNGKISSEEEEKEYLKKLM